MKASNLVSLILLICSSSSSSVDGAVDHPAPLLRGGDESNVEAEKRKKDQGCVSLLVYKDQNCRIGPVRKLQFPTSTRPGSPCYTDATMPFTSVKNQYCDVAKGEFHQTYYFGTDDCHIGWFNKWWSKELNQTFTSHQCMSGLRLDFCRKGRCPRPVHNGTVPEGGDSGIGNGYEDNEDVMLFVEMEE